MRDAKAAAAAEFRPNEFFETLLRIKRDQPRRYEREVSAGMQRRVESYECRMSARERKAAA
jgi:hypothetical protein